MKSLAFAVVFGLALCARTADSQTLTTLVEFTGFTGGGPANDSVPLGSLTLAGTTLYGTALGGGDHNLGTVFSVGTDGTDFQNRYSFTGGTASGVEPACNLTLIGTTLYGTVPGGADGYGAIFSVGTDGTNYQNVVSFTGIGGMANGNGPSNLTLSGTTFYGTTGGGGAYGYGNIYSVGTNGTNFQNLVAFTGTGGTANGDKPTAGGPTLVGATLYGMTYEGGTGGFTNLGTLFSVGMDGTNYQNLVSFTGSTGTASGAQPFGKLTLGGASLYGMTFSGGANGIGNIFSIGVGGGNYQSLVSFTGTGGAASGQNPYGSLTLSGTSLYGVTHSGGAYGYGNIFSVGVDGSGYQNLYSFTGGSDGAYPEGDLTLSGGTLFGTTSVGGIGTGYNGQGTVFALGLPPSARAAHKYVGPVWRRELEHVRQLDARCSSQWPRLGGGLGQCINRIVHDNARREPDRRLACVQQQRCGLHDRGRFRRHAHVGLRKQPGRVATAGPRRQSLD